MKTTALTFIILLVSLINANASSTAYILNGATHHKSTAKELKNRASRIKLNEQGPEKQYDIYIGKLL